MRGIIVKPAPCCTSKQDLGKIVKVKEIKLISSLFIEEYIECAACGNRDFDLTKFYYTDIYHPDYPIAVHKSRIKWFNDDLDKQIQEEEDNVERIKGKEVV